jgi:DNA-binding IclR family transcriptional regulator
MRTVLSAFRVLEEVAYAQPVGVGELSRALRLPKSTVQRALRTLWTAGWICPAGAEVTRWMLTTRALHIGQHAVADLSVRDASVAIMHELRDRTGETIHLMVREGDRAVLIERVETRHAVRAVVELGSSVPLHGSSNGKAMLAPLSHERIKSIIGTDLERYTDSTIVDWDEFLAELAEVGKRGYATNLGEWRTDIAAVAAPIFGHDGEPVGSLSVSTPDSRMPEHLRESYGALVAEATRRISATMGYRHAPDPG